MNKSGVKIWDEYSSRVKISNKDLYTISSNRPNHWPIMNWTKLFQIISEDAMHTHKERGQKRVWIWWQNESQVCLITHGGTRDDEVSIGCWQQLLLFLIQGLLQILLSQLNQLKCNKYLQAIILIYQKYTLKDAIKLYDMIKNQWLRNWFQNM